MLKKGTLLGFILGAVLSALVSYFTLVKYWYGQDQQDAPFHAAYNSLIYCMAHIPIYTEYDSDRKPHTVNDLRDVAQCVHNSAEQ